MEWPTTRGCSPEGTPRPEWSRHIFPSLWSKRSPSVYSDGALESRTAPGSAWKGPKTASRHHRARPSALQRAPTGGGSTHSVTFLTTAAEKSRCHPANRRQRHLRGCQRRKTHVENARQSAFPKSILAAMHMNRLVRHIACALDAYSCC